MNSLSYLIYLANVVNNIQQILFPVVFLLFIISVLTTFLGIFLHSIFAKNLWEEKRIMCVKAAKRFWFILAFCFVVLIFTPSSKTIYAIAASEIGEKVLMSEQIQGMSNDALRAVRIWINNQIEGGVKSP